MKSSDIYPGWKMTVRQHGLYFRLFAAACETAHASTAAAKESLRQAAHRAAFGRPKSARDINRTKDFDAIATEFKRMANVVDAADPARRRALFVAHERLETLAALTSTNWVATLLRDRFKIVAGVRAVEDLTDKDLALLITTANDRIKIFKNKAAVEVEANGDPVW